MGLDAATTGVALLAALAALGLALAAAAGLLAVRRGLRELALGVGQGNAELGGRLAQLADHVQSGMAHQMRQLGDGLAGQTRHTSRTLAELGERLAVIDAAQRHIAELSEQVVGLQDILSNKQARGAFGEVQLENLVRDALPPSAYAFQAVLGNQRRVDCLLRLPHPPGAIAVDAKFPLESWHALRAAPDDPQAARAFAAAVRRHLVDIAERYIVPGETAESALLFLPSEAVYAELHARFPQVVEEGFRRKVFVVSPTTLMATLNTVRAVLKDASTREAASAIQREVRHLLDDARRLGERVEKLRLHARQMEDDLDAVRRSTERLLQRGERIDAVALGEPVPEIGAPVAPATTLSQPRT